MGTFNKIITTAALYVYSDDIVDTTNRIKNKTDQAKAKKRKKYLDSCMPGEKGLVLNWFNDATIDDIEVSDASGETVFIVNSRLGDRKRNLIIFDGNGKEIARIKDGTNMRGNKGTYVLTVGKQKVGVIEASSKSGVQEYVTSDKIRIYKGKKDKDFHMYGGGTELGRITKQGVVANFRYVVTYPNDAPDLMFLFISLIVYIFNSMSKMEARREERTNDVY